MFYVEPFSSCHTKSVLFMIAYLYLVRVQSSFTMQRLKYKLKNDFSQVLLSCNHWDEKGRRCCFRYWSYFSSDVKANPSTNHHRCLLFTLQSLQHGQYNYRIHNHATVSFIRLNQWIYFDQICILVFKNLTREIILKNFENQPLFWSEIPPKMCF